MPHVVHVKHNARPAPQDDQESRQQAAGSTAAYACELGILCVNVNMHDVLSWGVACAVQGQKEIERNNVYYKV